MLLLPALGPLLPVLLLLLLLQLLGSGYADATAIAVDSASAGASTDASAAIGADSACSDRKQEKIDAQQERGAGRGQSKKARVTFTAR